MNAFAGLFLNGGRRAGALRLAACAGAAAWLGGCMSYPFATAPVDPDSPAAAEVAARARANQDYPAFSEIPKLPADVRPPAAFARAAAELEAERAAVLRQTAPETWTLHDTEGFAARARAAAGAEPPAAAGAGDTEAFARELRERATPPPPAR